MAKQMTALVTGGAGLIGSHIVDAACSAGWHVRVMDNLEPQTHRFGKPQWIRNDVEFLQGDVRHRSSWGRALRGIDIVLHQAAFGGYMPNIAKFIQVNSYGTALMLETIRDRALPVKKVVLASSQAVYDEGAYRCPLHGQFYGAARDVDRLEAGMYDVPCQACGQSGEPAPTSEDAPIGGRNVYAISKFDQERLLLTWSDSTGIPAVALRYSCTYGPRQSLFNPYTGVIAIFCTRLVNDLPPVIFEDGRQSRDLIFVEDVARANLLVATNDDANGRVLNVGTGHAVEIAHLARLLAERLGKAIEPSLPGTFRTGEMRSLVSDISRISSLGFQPKVELECGIDRYLKWVSTQGDVRDYFSAAERVLRAKRIVRPVRTEGGE